MAPKFVKGSPTGHGLYAFSSKGKNIDFYSEINSETKNTPKNIFYCYLGPIPKIEPAEQLERVFIEEILGKLIAKNPIFVTNKKTGNEIGWIMPISITKRNDEVFINDTYGCLSYEFWKKVE